MAISLDGVVARTDQSLDWLFKQKAEGADHGFAAVCAAVCAQVDGLVMGSR